MKCFKKLTYPAQTLAGDKLTKPKEKENLTNFRVSIDRLYINSLFVLIQIKY